MFITFILLRTKMRNREMIFVPSVIRKRHLLNQLVKKLWMKKNGNIISSSHLGMKTFDGFMNHLFCVLNNTSQKIEKVIARINNVSQNLKKKRRIFVTMAFTVHHMLWGKLVNIKGLYYFILLKNLFSRKFSNILIKVNWQYFVNFTKFLFALKDLFIVYQQKNIYTIWKKFK